MVYSLLIFFTSDSNDCTVRCLTIIIITKEVVKGLQVRLKENQTNMVINNHKYSEGLIKKQV